MGRGKRKRASSGLAAEARLPRLNPFDIADRPTAAVLAELDRFREELARGAWAGALGALQSSPTRARRAPELKPLLAELVAQALRDQNEELLEGAARRYLASLRLVELRTPQIVKPSFNHPLLHLRVSAAAKHTLCGATLTPRWQQAGRRGSFAGAAGVPAGRSGRPRQCAKCAKRAGAVPAALESPHFPVLEDAEREQALALAAARVLALLDRAELGAPELLTTWREVSAAARLGAVTAFRDIAVRRAQAQGPDWLLEHWLGRDLSPFVRASYAEPRLPTPAEWQAFLDDDEDAKRLFSSSLDWGVPAYLPARAVFHTWPKAVAAILAHYASTRHTPLPVAKLKDLCEARRAPTA